MKKKIIIFALTSFLALCAVTTVLFRGKSNTFAAVSEVDYALWLHEYEIKDFTSEFSVVDPDGNTVVTQGSFICNIPGRYEVYKNGELLYYVIALQEPKVVTFTYDTDLKSNVYAGETLVLPRANAFSEIEEFALYTVEVKSDDRVLRTFADVNSEVSYYFAAAGDYKVVYSVVDRFGTAHSDERTVSVTSARVIVNADMPSSWAVLSTIDFSAVSGFYEGIFYDVQATIEEPDGTVAYATAGSYVPTKQGLHRITFTSLVAGEVVEKTVSIDVRLSEVSLFSNGYNIASVTDSSDTPKNTGVEIANAGAGAYIYYNKIINLNDFTSDDEIISFYCRYDEEFHSKKMRVKLTDVNDETNSISVYWRHETAEGQTRFTYMLVEFNGYALGINNQKTDWTGTLGKPRETYGSMVSESMVSRTSPLNFTFDCENNAIYTKYAKTKQLVLDLDDQEALGSTRTVWKGFSSNYVYLSLDFIDNVSSAVQINSIGGESFVSSSPELSDENYVRFNYDGKYVTDESKIDIEAYKGHICKLPEPIKSDILFGNIAVEFSVLKKVGGNYQSVSGLNGYSFTPSTAGNYKAVYTYTDKYGVSRKKEFAFTVQDAVPPAIVITGESKTADIMSYCELPEITVSGGVKTVKTVISLMYNGVPVTAKDGRVFLDKPGKVTIDVVATDFLNQMDSQQYVITVNRNVMIIELEEEPLTFIAGKEYTLPDFTATDYSFESGENGYNMSKSIYVGTQKIGNDRKYTYNGNDDSVTLRYYGGKGTGRETYKDVTVRIVKSGASGVPAANYFGCSAAKTTATLFEQGLCFDCNATDEISFPNPVPVNDFSFEFSLLKNKFPSGLTLQLTDYKNSEQQLNIVLGDFSDAKWSISSNDKLLGSLVYTGGKYSTGAKAGQEYFSSTLKLASNGATVNNSTNDKISVISEYASGKKFEGFDSGLVTVKLTVNCASSSSLVLTGVANQAFSTYSLKNNADKTGPSLALEKDLNLRFPYSSVISVPKAIAYDILQGGIKGGITLIITKPDGSKVNLNGGAENDFVFNQYGLYGFSYTAQDSSGNKTTYEKSVTVYDNVLPTISVSGTVRTSYKVGETLTLPSFTASDNVKIETKAVFIQDVQSKLAVADGSYRFTKAGTYRLIFFAKDSEGNTAKKTYEIKVGE